MEYTVGSWCPTPDGSGPAVAVGLELKVDEDITLMVRFHSPAAVDELIEALLFHKNDVWPDGVNNV